MEREKGFEALQAVNEKLRRDTRLPHKSSKRLGKAADRPIHERTCRRLVPEHDRREYDGTARRGAGRPGTASSLRELVVRFATENPTWGYTRIRDVLGNLGHVLAHNTIKRILREHGLEPAPLRGRRMPWATFLNAHLGSISATDFFTVEVLTLGGLVRYFVLFVIDIETRRVQIAGIVRQPHGAWMKQIARNLTDNVDGFLGGKRYLIRDRDPLFTDEFRELLRAAA